jgi:hypothetical protein
MPRHVARLVVNYFTYAVRLVASACRAACRVTHRRLLHLAQARRRLLRLRRASGCHGTSRDSSRGSSSTTSPTTRVRLLRHVARLVVKYFKYAARLVMRLVVDYCAYAVRLVASARRAATRAARRRLLHLRHASGSFGTSRGLSRDSTSTTSPRAGSLLTTVGEVGLRKPHPRSATLTTFGPHAASASRRNLRGAGVNRKANTALVT